jgi:hypothetical protein
MTDEALLELATDDGRVMATFNVADFPDLARALKRALIARPDQSKWVNSTIFVSRSGR